MKKAIIHIGGHKTGTTAIQHTLFESASLLNEQGICYPLELTCKEALFWGQHSLAWHLMDVQVGENFKLSQHQIDQSLDTLEHLTEQYSNLVISSENFMRLDDNAISRLKTSLSDFDIYVLIYVRRQDDATSALYQTDIIHYHESKKIDDWLANKIFLFDYFSIIKRWEALTNGKIIVRPYDRKKLTNGDVVNDFNAVLDDVFEQKVSLRAASKQNLFNNQSLPASITSLVRYYNTTPTKERVRPALIRLGYELNSLKIKSNFELISPSIRQSILERFHEGNLELSKKYLGLNEIWFDEVITENDTEWRKKNAFNGSELLALVNETLNAITSLKENNREL